MIKSCCCFRSFRSETESRCSFIRDRETRGQSWRLDAIEMHLTRQAVDLRPVDAEVGGGRAGRLDLWPDACIGGLQSAIAQIWPVGADGGVERITAPWVDIVVEAVDPFDIGAEACLSREVQCQMDAEPRCFRHRIDQA